MWRKYGKHLIEITEICMPSLVQTSQDTNDIALRKILLMGIVCVVFLWLPLCGFPLATFVWSRYETLDAVEPKN